MILQKSIKEEKVGKFTCIEKQYTGAYPEKRIGQ